MSYPYRRLEKSLWIVLLFLNVALLTSVQAVAQQTPPPVPCRTGDSCTGPNGDCIWFQETSANPFGCCATGQACQVTYGNSCCTYTCTPGWNVCPNANGELIYAGMCTKTVHTGGSWGRNCSNNQCVVPPPGQGGCDS